jgi:1-aminocyclopropane-1-carboxylate deaminase/D-cysteine desulfhydrase-like pyridoxal-dependent ACC family enzyme
MLGATRLRELLAGSRVRLNNWPTPLHELRHLPEVLESPSRLWVKRDDLTSVSFGGTKIRKLEVLAGEAVESGADVLVAAGGVRSNCTRAVAQVAAMLGIECVLVVDGTRPPAPSGNLLLSQQLGASLRFVARREDRGAEVQSVIEQLIAKGKNPFVVPVSAATPRSALAMTAAMVEVIEQGPAPDVIVVCSSSGATQAGLLLGIALESLPTRVLGVSPDDRGVDVARRIAELLADSAALLGLGPRALAGVDVEVDDGFVGDCPLGPTETAREAADLLMRSEGLLVDPIYSSRAAAALVSGLRGGRFTSAESILLWHTGGLPGIFG